jgi:ABC-type phosphate/phosphonate transport system substrate-binding protein
MATIKGAVVLRSFVYAGLLALVVAVGLSPRVGAEDRTGPLKLGMLQGMFKDVPEAFVHAAAKPFSDLFQKQTGLKGDVELVPDYEALAARMKEGKLHVGVFHGFEFAWVRDRYPELQPLAVTIPPRRKIQACLVVHTDSEANGPKDLKGPCVAVPMFTNAHCRLFLERVRGNLPAGCCDCAKHDPLSPEEVLDGVAQGQLASALVDISAMTAYHTNKPGAFRQLRVLCESEPFPPAVIVFRKEALTSAAVTKIRDGLTRAKETAQGRAFLMLWQLQGFEDVPADFDVQMRRIAKAYPAPGPGKPPADKIAPPE